MLSLTKRILPFALYVALFMLPLPAFAASFEITGWIPYWRAATGTADVLPHLDLLTEVNPFVYTLKSDGTLYENNDLSAEPWKSFIAQAQAKGVRVIPTVMTGNGKITANVSFQERLNMNKSPTSAVKNSTAVVRVVPAIACLTSEMSLMARAIRSPML